MLRRAGFRQAAGALQYGLIALTAWAAATLVVKVVGVDLHPRVQTKAVDDSAARAPRSRQAGDDAIILKRNLFGAPDVEVAGEEGGGPAATTADLRLRGVASSGGRSFAVFENTASGEQNVFAVGDRVFDGPKLVSVDPGGADVVLKGRKKRYQILEDDASGEAAPDKAAKPLSKRAAARAAKAAGGRGTTPHGEKKEAPSSAGVKKTGENAYLVDRREVEHVVANLNEVITQARAVPMLADGKSAGFKLSEIRPGSIFDKIGLVNGDVVQRVNDTELSDPSKAVGLLEEIQSMGQIRVNFVRGGSPRSYTYTIR